MAKIRWTLEAEKWLREIYEYIAKDNRDAAKKVVDGIFNKVQLLKDFPKIGYKYKEEKEGEIRILLYGHYRIAYLVREGDVIDVLGIFHGAMDLDRYLKIIS